MATTQNSGYEPQFANPTAADLQGGSAERYPLVEYSAMKTSQLSAGMVDKEYVQRAREAFKAGFHFWDKGANGGNGARVAIDKFTFVVLETYSALSGYVEGGAGQPSASYYSNKVKDSSVEPFSLWLKGSKHPVMSGYYRGRKSANDSVKLCARPNTEANADFNMQPGNHSVVPAGVSFHQHFVVWWVEGQRPLEMKLTTMVSREIKKAISEAYSRAGSKVPPEWVNLFRLADSSLWMFRVTGFARMTKDGEPYENKGDMFLLPKFECGIVPEKVGDGKNAFYDEMRAQQAAVRDSYEAEKQRRAKYANAQEREETSRSENPPHDHAFPTAEHARPQNDFHPDAAFPPFEDDDLPF